LGRNKAVLIRAGEVVQLRIVDKNSHEVLSTYEFLPNKEIDNITFFEIAEKLGFSFKRYKRDKDIEWQ
jgi:hypothetical protein